uniref:Riboflavin kinase n=1 Tax=Eutreptiella gymnastica TaxID=73025 RepID=A0A7S4G686_9EUGL
MEDLPAIVKCFQEHLSRKGGEIIFPKVFNGPVFFPPKAAVLFDFDGTLGDTETPAMEVAYWELAPYLPNVSADKLEEEKVPFIQHNAGRAFEHMIENVNEARAKEGLPDVETAHSSAGVDLNEAAVAVVDAARSRFGLVKLADAKPRYDSLLKMQKDETVVALGKCAEANPGVIKMLEELTAAGIPFNIATTSGKPRVPVCVDTAGLRRFFPDSKIHSGESDFDPPRFKPDPNVYLKAAADEKMPPSSCIAVEDSASGVGSAANAKIGLIVGYVGSSHIPESEKESHAQVLLEGAKSKDGRGAELVISNMLDLPAIVHCFHEFIARQDAALVLPTQYEGRVYAPE